MRPRGPWYCAPCAVARMSSATSLRFELGGEARAHLVGQHMAPHRLGLARLEIEQLERPVREADQPVHVDAEVGEDAAHLAVLALAQAHGDPAVGALHALDAGLDRAVAHALDLDAVLQLVEVGLLHASVRPHLVAPQPAGCRQLHVAGEGAVVGEQQQPFAVEVEPPDGDDARQPLGQVLEHGRPALRIGVRGDEAARFVIAPELRRLGRRQRLAVDQHLVLPRHLESGRRQQPAVDVDAALLDPALRLAARAQPGPCHRLGDAQRLVRPRLGRLRRRSAARIAAGLGKRLTPGLARKP